MLKVLSFCVFIYSLSFIIHAQSQNLTILRYRGTAVKMEKVMSDSEVMQYVNILTAIFHLSKNKIYLSCGKYRAAKGPYQEITVFK